MKRMVRLISFVAGVAALIWAMRDRFISLALPREPQPPAFRHPDDHPHVPHREHQEPKAPQDSVAQPGDDLKLIKGIGPVFASKLANMGIASFVDLAAASAGVIASDLDTAESRATDWIEQARQKI
jgi:predicted flap endonuclease-1-like 5' DNA nuclease